jgi:hypothetical protein
MSSKQSAVSAACKSAVARVMAAKGNRSLTIARVGGWENTHPGYVREFFTDEYFHFFGHIKGMNHTKSSLKEVCRIAEKYYV